MNYKDITSDYIINWCQSHNQVDWLRAKLQETREYKIYPRIRYKDDKGKTRTKVDKTQEPTIERRPISFVELKEDFRTKFLIDEMPKAKKKKTMLERLEGL